LSRPIHDVSPELLAAQARLIKLRQQLGKTEKGPRLPKAVHPHGRFPLTTPLPSPWPSPAHLPTHLGWESASVTAVLRRQYPAQTTTPSSPLCLLPLVHPKATDERPLPTTGAITFYPDIALAMLRTNQTPAGRVWLLLRQIDLPGRGWVEDKVARQMLAEQQSPWRICGWRQLRNLLHQGDGLFWRRQNGRLWLVSLAKVAKALDIEHLEQRPISLPLTTLLQPMSQVRAHFYASFHSSRQNQRETPPAPISRAALSELAQISSHTQRAYEKRAGVRAQTHFAIGEPATPEKEEEGRWQRGRALFRLTDYRGAHGRPDGVYLAWQLPNSYHGPHRLAKRGRQKRINHVLADLLRQGTTGNGHYRFEQRNRPAKRYFSNGRLAAKALNQSCCPNELYWPDLGKPQSLFSKVRIWHILAKL
jgi:hypothetical protein